MKKKELRLYLRRITSHLDSIYDEIELRMPETAEREDITRFNLNLTTTTEKGDILALLPLSTFIDELKSDIDEFLS